MSDSPPPPPEGPEPPRMVRSPPGLQKPQQQQQQQSTWKTRGSKPISCVVILLDGETLQTSIHKKALGSLLLERVSDHLDLLEKDYFGLTYRDDLDPMNTRYWLDVNKTVAHQKKRGKWEFEFAVKFYPPDPTVLKESLTRYLVCLQIRKEIATGRLACTFATQAVLGSFILQADLGDWEQEEHGEGIDYIRDIPFAPNQTPELLEKIAELHRDRKGMMPEQAELQYLEYAKKIAMYGIHLHPAKDSDYVDILIGVGASGISIFRENLRINRFVWPKVLKISYRRNKFLIRIRPGEFETFESWIAFKLPTNKLAKRLWKLAIEHHAFLRLREAIDVKRGVLPRFGSKYRYSGRTLYETRVNTESRPAPFFERTGSKQYLNNNRTRSFDSLPLKQRSPTARDPNMSVGSASDSFEELPTERPENSRVIRPDIREDERAPKITRPPENRREENGRPVTEIKVEHRFVQRQDEKEPELRSAKRNERGPQQRFEPRDERGPQQRSTVHEDRGPERRFTAREDDGPERTMRLPDPPTEEPGPKRSNQPRGVPTALATVGLPRSAKRKDDSPRGSIDSAEDLEDRRPATKPKPLVAPKPKKEKKPIQEMDL